MLSAKMYHDPVKYVRQTDIDQIRYKELIMKLAEKKESITRKDVTVLGINDTVASIEETLKNNTIVYLEDRQITDGCEVIVY